MAGSSWPSLVAGARAKASEVEAKFDWIEGDLVPMAAGSKADATYDLGQSAFRFRDIYISRQYLGPAGSAGTPSFSQQGSANGFYFPTTSRIATTSPMLLPDGAVGAPSGTWLNSPTTGWYRIGADNIGYAAAGVKAIDISSLGAIVKPLQPCFLAIWTVANTAMTLDSLAHTLTASWSEEIDQGSNFSGGVFTAPVTGRYRLSFNTAFSNETGGIGANEWDIVTTARSYATEGLVGNLTAGGYTGKTLGVAINVVAPMTAGDKAYITYTASVNTSTSAIQFRGGTGTALTFFSGELF